MTDDDPYVVESLTQLDLFYPHLYETPIIYSAFETHSCQSYENETWVVIAFISASSTFLIYDGGFENPTISDSMHYQTENDWSDMDSNIQNALSMWRLLHHAAFRSAAGRKCGIPLSYIPSNSFFLKPPAIGNLKYKIVQVRGKGAGLTNIANES